VVDGDVLVFAAVFSSATGFFTVLPGWTELLNTGTGSSSWLQILTKIAAGEPASYTWSNPNGAMATCGIMGAISGAGALDQFTQQNNVSTGSNVPAAPLTPAKANEVLVWIADRPAIGASGNLQAPTNQVMQGRVNTGNSLTPQLIFAAVIYTANVATVSTWHTGSFSGGQTSRSFAAQLAFLDAVPSTNVPLLFCEA
jgi:hypothetical protein